MIQPVAESILIAAPPEVIYDLVADVARMGEWSPEATGAKKAPKVLSEGDKFTGTNKHGLARWSTQCTVLRAQRGQRFEFDVDFQAFPISRWMYEFVPDGDKTRVTETWIDRRMGSRGKLIKGLGQILIPGNREEHNRANMLQTLRKLKAEAEG